MDNARIEKIALHRYGLDSHRLRMATQLHSGKPPEKRYMIDPQGLDTKIVRSPQMEVLLRAYVTRRVICAGRLLMLFERLRDDATRAPLPGMPPPHRWAVEPCGAVMQLTPSIGGSGYTQACHTSPTQVTLAGQYPWTLARSAALKQEFVTWFGDIYVMPDTVNETDSLIEREGDSGLGNRRLFADAVQRVLGGQRPIDELHDAVRRLGARIEASDAYRCDGIHRDWVLGVHLATLAPALSLAQRELPNYAAEVSKL